MASAVSAKAVAAGSAVVELVVAAWALLLLRLLLLLLRLLRALLHRRLLLGALLAPARHGLFGHLRPMVALNPPISLREVLEVAAGVVPGMNPEEGRMGLSSLAMPHGLGGHGVGKSMGW